MNKIRVKNGQIETNINQDIIVDIIDRFEMFDIKKIVIKPLKDTKLEIEYNNVDIKIDVEFQIPENIKLEVFEIKTEDKSKTQYQYTLEKNSTLNITKFCDSKEIKQLDVVDLNGENATLNYKLKTITNGEQKYDIYVFHNCPNTISNISNNGVNLTGNITFNVTGTVYNGIKNCELNQNNRIITFNEQKCIINPKFLIDEQDVIANHSALIGKFEEEELFYMQTRGIDYNQAVSLLLKGFLLEDLSDERLNTIIEKYWR